MNTHAVVGGVAAIMAALATWQVTSWQKDARYDRLVASNATVMHAYADRATAAEERERTEENRRREEKDKIDAETTKNIAAATAAAVAAGTERDRLRASLAAYTARQRAAGASPTAGAVGPGVAGADSLDLLTGLLQRHSDELVTVGGYADSLRIVGAACERSYDSLTGKP